MRQLFAVFFALLPLSSFAQDVLPTTDAVIYTTKGEVPLRLEVATTEATREEGLMNRTSLEPHDGMLFLFPTPSDYSFWMKNTSLPLDMIFIGPDQTVVAIAANTKPFSLATHHAGKPVEAVIELDGGRAAKDAVAVGDKVGYGLPKSLKIQ